MTRAPARIGVFRALMLGDMLCAVPAMRALAAHWPQAERVLIGLPWARDWAERLPCIDRFVPFPGWPGLPEREPDLAALPEFLQAMQQEGFDLLLQLHGSGGIVNPLLASWAPRRLAGFVEPAGWCSDPALHPPWPTQGSEVERLLRLTDHLGVPRAGTALEWPLTEADRCAARRLIGPGAPHAVVHAGARYASRRWPARRFAEVADRLAAAGFRVLLTGSGGEQALVAEVAAAMRGPCLPLAGCTDLWTLGALVAEARVVVCNDTGISHVAAATGTPSVVVSSGSDVARWAPQDAQRHRVLWQDMDCRPCGFEHCPHGHGCAWAVSAQDVARAALEQARRAERAAPALETTE